MTTSAENNLPPPLNASSLPWVPDWDHQARVPRDGDGWKARVGHLQLELDATNDSLTSSTPGRLTFELRLYHAFTGQMIDSWELEDLSKAPIIAESAIQMLQSSLLRSLERTKGALHDAL